MSKRQVSIAIVALVLACSGCKRAVQNSKTEQQANIHIERAENYRQQGQYRAAIIEARAAIDAAPQDRQGIVELASLLNDLDQSKQTLRILEPLENSNDRSVIIARADALIDAKKFRSALDYLHTHANKDPEIRFRLAQAQAGAGEKGQAQANLLALQNSVLATKAKIQLARLYVDEGNSAEANTLVKDVLQSNPKQIDALMLNAQLAEQRGDLTNAEAILSQALINLPRTDIITPQKTAVLKQIMPVLTKLGRSSESLVYAKVLADADPQGTILQSKFQEGMEAFKAGKLDDAEKLIGEVYEQSHDASAGIALGMIRYSKKDYRGAAKYLSENVDPETAPDTAVKTLASAEMQLGQTGKLLQLIGPEEREHIKDPELKALLGVALAQAGNNASGERLLIDTLNSDPKNTAVRATLARHYLIAQQPAKAIATLEEGLALQPDNGLQRLLVGAYIVAGKIDTALQQARKLAASLPEQASNYYVLGHTALLAQQYEDSANALHKALALEPDYLPAQLENAHLQLLRKQPQAAAEIYQRIIEKHDNTDALKGFVTAMEMNGAKPGDGSVEKRILQVSDSANARAVIAEYYLRNQLRADAERLLTNLSSTPGDNYPSYVKQLYALAQASDLLREKDFNRAALTAMDGLQQNPRNPDLLALLARIQIGAGAMKEAEKFIDELEQVQPNSPALLDLRASIAFAQGDKNSALQKLRALWNNMKTDQTGNKLYQALSQTDANAATQFLSEWQAALPNSDSPLLLRAVAFERAGDEQQAQKFYEAALAHNGNNVWTLNNLALLYLAKGDVRAVALAKKAYELQPKNPAVLDTYGWILVSTKEQQKGIALLQEAAALAPTSEEIKKHLSLAQAQ